MNTNETQSPGSLHPVVGPTASRLVRGYWAEPNVCPSCGYMPIQTSLMLNSGKMLMRFECPNCDQAAPKYKPSHAEACEAWNAMKSSRPNAPHEPPPTGDSREPKTL